MRQALPLAQASDSEPLQALLNQALGETIFLLGDYAAAENYISAGYRFAQQLNWPRAMITGYKGLGRIHLAHGDYQQAEEQLRVSVDLTRRYHYRSLCLDCVITLGEALRLQGRMVEAKSCLAEGRQIADALGSAGFRAMVAWEEGCLAEQCGEYQAAKALFNTSLAAIGLTPWWSHALPTLGWALIGLGELEKAESYFQKVLSAAIAQARLPISLDAEAGLAYLRTPRSGNGTRHLLEQSNEAEPVASVFQRVYQHIATMQETRSRVARLAATIGMGIPSRK